MKEIRLDHIILHCKKCGLGCNAELWFNKKNIKTGEETPISEVFICPFCGEKLDNKTKLPKKLLI